MITCDEIIVALGDISGTINSTVSANFYNEKVRYKRDCYILNAVFASDHITFYYCYHLLSLSQS